MQRMLGEAYFRLGLYDSAKLVLDKYAERIGLRALSRDDNYLLGVVDYKMQKWESAAKYLERVPTVEDSVTQNAYYHLGDCYLHLGDDERAQKALGLASELTYDKIVQEDALFNYAKLLYEHRYNPFSDAVAAFARYIELFPNSKRRGIHLPRHGLYGNAKLSGCFGCAFQDWHSQFYNASGFSTRLLLPRR